MLVVCEFRFWQQFSRLKQLTTDDTDYTEKTMLGFVGKPETGCRWQLVCHCKRLRGKGGQAAHATQSSFIQQFSDKA